MKKILLSLIAVMILVFSSVLIYHVSTDDSITISQTDEKGNTTEDVMNEIDESILSEGDEVEIGEMI